MFHLLGVVYLGSIIAAAGPPTSPESNFFSSQVFGIIIGGIISASVSFIGIIIVNEQQEQRDERAYKRQVEREKEADRWSLRDAKRERLRSSYKVLLNAANAYQTEAKQMNHMASPDNISLTGVDDAVNEIRLDTVGSDVLISFFGLKGAFYELAVRLQSHEKGSTEETARYMHEVTVKADELNIVMNKHLKELEY